MNTTQNEALPIIGILGDGQLAMMMAQAYRKLGGCTYIFSASENAPANEYADQVFYGDDNSIDDLNTFFEAVDIVTLENEFIDSQLLSLASLRCSTPMSPDPKRFGLIEDKLLEKRFFQKLDVNLADFFEVLDEQDLVDKPGFLKIAKGGYDGIGTYQVNSKIEAIEVYRRIKSSGSILFEAAVDFEKELSVIAVSGCDNIVFYPVVETHQESGTCRYVSFPAGIAPEVEREAKSQVERILLELNTIGLFAFEFFLDKNNQLIVNESAPRPHNSGHITLDLTDCSQFENHMRAVAGMELIEPSILKESMTMVNLLGTRDGAFDSDEVLNSIHDDDSSVTLYNKRTSRIKRKMGHINLWGSEQSQRAKNLAETLKI